MLHVLPKNEEHSLDTICNCNPKIECLEQILVIHNSFDGRELFESEHEASVYGGWVVVEQ